MYFLYLGAKGLFLLEMVKTAKTGIARKCVRREVPFQSGTQLPNSNTRSGSFRSWLLYPALVRVSVSAFPSVFAVF